MKRKRILSLMLSAALALSLAGCGGTDEDGAKGNTVSGVAVQVKAAALDTIYTENRVSGKIASDNDTLVNVASSVKCNAVYVKAGQDIRAGQAICELEMDSTISNHRAVKISYESAVKSYEDQSAVFESQIKLYEKNLSDLKQLYTIGAAAQAEIDAAELQLLSAKATRDSTLAQLEAGIENYRSSLEQLDLVLHNIDENGNVIAPVSGTILSLTAVEGSYISPSMPVATIGDASSMKIDTYVSEALVPKLTIGDKADIYVSAADVNFDAVISRIDSSANMQTKLYTVELDVPSYVQSLLSGMSADVSFRTDVSNNAVVIPTEAIITIGDSQQVFIVQDNTAKAVTVKTGLISGNMTEITEGLAEGDLVITVGQTYVADGDAVRVVSGEGA